MFEKSQWVKNKANLEHIRYLFKYIHKNVHTYTYIYDVLSRMRYYEYIVDEHTYSEDNLLSTLERRTYINTYVEYIQIEIKTVNVTLASLCFCFWFFFLFAKFLNNM